MFNPNFVQNDLFYQPEGVNLTMVWVKTGFFGLVLLLAVLVWIETG